MVLQWRVDADRVKNARSRHDVHSSARASLKISQPNGDGHGEERSPTQTKRAVLADGTGENHATFSEILAYADSFCPDSAPSWSFFFFSRFAFLPDPAAVAAGVAAFPDL